MGSARSKQPRPAVSLELTQPVEGSQCTEVSHELTQPVEGSQCTEVSHELTQPVEGSQCTYVSHELREPVEGSQCTKVSHELRETVKGSQCTEVSHELREAVKGSRCTEVSHELREAVKGSQWTEAVRLIHRADCSEQRHWAITHTLQNVPVWFVKENLDDILACAGDQLDSVLSPLLTRLASVTEESSRFTSPALCFTTDLCKCVGRVLQRDISNELHRRAVVECAKHIYDYSFDLYILPQCVNEELDDVLSHLVSRCMWRSVGNILKQGVSHKRRLWALHQASRSADDYDFTTHILPHSTGVDLEQMLTHLVSRGLWMSAGEVVRQGVSEDRHRFAVIEASRHADDFDFVHFILPHCQGENLDLVLSHLVSRGRWGIMQCAIERGVSSEQRTRIIEQASRLASGKDFVRYILPHCNNEHSDKTISHLMSRGLWWTVGKVLGRGHSDDRHRWAAVVEASRHVGDDDFTKHILPYCTKQEQEHVLTHLVLRGMWMSVENILRWHVCDDRHRRTVVEASRHVGDDDFIAHILPHCTQQEQKHMLTHLVLRGMWRSVGLLLRRGVGKDRRRWYHVLFPLMTWGHSEQRTWSIEQASRYASDRDFVMYILYHCDDIEMDSIFPTLVSRGLWMAVGRVLLKFVVDDRYRWAVVDASRFADDDDFAAHILPCCKREELEQVLTYLVSRGLWKSVGKILGWGVSDDRHRWAVEEARRFAKDDELLQHIFPHCLGEEMEQVLTQLVSRGLWREMGKVLKQGVGDVTHRWVLEQASKHADYDQFVEFILPQCHGENLDYVLSHLMSQGRWWLLQSVIRRGVGSEQRTLIIEQASKHAGDRAFVEYILPHCHDEHMDNTITTLMSRGLWSEVGKILGRGLNDERHRWTLSEAAEHADDKNFDLHILPHCSEDDVVAVLPLLVASRKWNCVQQVLYDVVRDTLLTWVTSRHDSTAHDTLFWKLIHDCRVDVSLALVLTKAVTGNIVHRERSRKMRHGWGRKNNSNFKARLDGLVSGASWQRDLCEALMTSLLHTLCHVMCSDDTQYAENTTQCVSGIFTHITACIKENATYLQHNRLKTIQNRDKWTEVFSELADAHQNDPLFLLHFLQGLNLHHTRRQGENDDAMLLVILVVFPLLPQLQSVALRMMLRKKRWDVLSQACLSHVWEHDRRQLFEAAVLQRKWSVVRRWSDHAVHDDERDWVMAEILKEALKHRAVKEIFQNNFRKRITKKVQRNAFKAAFKSAFEDTIFQEAFKKTLEQKASSLSREPYNENVFMGRFKDDFSKAFQVSFNKDTFIRVFKDKAINEEIYKAIVTRDDFKEEALQEAFREAFKQKKFELNFKRKIAVKAFKLEALKGSFTDETYKEALKEEAFIYTFKEKKFEWKILQEVFPDAFPEWSFVKAFKEAFVCLQEEYFVCYKDAFLNAYIEKAIGSLLEAFREPFSDEDFTDTYEDKWMSYLLLADHGLRRHRHMHAVYMVCKYGPWDIVREMVERGGDLTEVHNLLGNWVTGNLRKKPQGDVTVYEQRYDELVRRRRSFATDSHLIPMDALEQGQWGTVMFNILHQPTQDYFSQVINKVIEEEQWHVLMHLVRLGVRSADRNRLFPKMVRQQRWGLCRMLLEQVVDEQLCMKALPELMDRNQWILVARVMEYNVDDALRRQVMQCVFHRRAGVAFWHCLNVMEDKQPLTKETRLKFFHQAISRDIWQAVKPLVGEEDGPGIQRRDMAFLEAIEQHVWHAVDYFQFNNINADINMKDENGETPLHREARKGEWIAVKELVFRDADPNLLDKDGVSVLNRLIHNRQWGIVKFVIMYGGDIHFPARYSEDENERHSPLQALITARQADVINMSFMWCGDQKKGVNIWGENCLHAICDSDYRWDAMEMMMLRRVDPLAVTLTGKSPLLYAVLNRKCPERMVAECSRMGFSSHQPSVTGPQRSLLQDIINALHFMWRYTPRYFDCQVMQQHSAITSPLVCAVLRDSAVLVHMLYESASCSRTEMATLYTQLPRLTDVTTEEGRTLHEIVQMFIEISPERADDLRQYYRRLTDAIERHTRLLRVLYSTPRTLRSSCRLRILEHFPIRNKKRLELLGDPRMLEGLPLPEPVKDYLQFSDLRGADYGKKMGLPHEDTLEVVSPDQRDGLSEDSTDLSSERSTDYSAGDLTDEEG